MTEVEGAATPSPSDVREALEQLREGVTTDEVFNLIVQGATAYATLGACLVRSGGEEYSLIPADQELVDGWTPYRIYPTLEEVEKYRAGFKKTFGDDYVVVSRKKAGAWGVRA